MKERTRIDQVTWDHLETEEILEYITSPEINDEDRKRGQQQLEMRGYVPQIMEISNKQHTTNTAIVYTNSLSVASLTISGLAGIEQVDSLPFMDPLRVEIKKMIDDGPRQSEIMLAANAITLNVLTNKMLQNASTAKNSETVEAFIDIALRAQDQTRKTLLALAQIKNPKHNTFVAQQNIASVQQVNNNLMSETTQANITNSENRLLSEAAHETLDTRRTFETIPVDPGMDAMVKINRCTNM